MNLNDDIESGMLLTQSGDTWNVTTAPIPTVPFWNGGMLPAFGRNLTATARSAEVKMSISGLSCVKQGVCRWQAREPSNDGEIPGLDFLGTPPPNFVTSFHAAVPSCASAM